MRVTVLALDDPWSGTSHAGTQRTLALVSALHELGHTVGVAYVAGKNSSPPRGPQLTVLPVQQPPVGERNIPPVLSRAKRSVLPLPTIAGAKLPELGRAVADLEHEVLCVTQLRAAQFASYVPAASLWLDLSDVWSLFIDNEIAARRGIQQLGARAQKRMVLRAEDRWNRRASAVSTAGFSDAKHLASRFERPVEWLPPPVFATPVPRREPAGSKTAGLLANFAYWPNVDAYHVIRDHWAPTLSARGWRVVVAGLHSETLEPSPHLEILGPLERVEDFYSQVDITLAPIRLGGGIKVKIMESLMVGRPVLATEYATQGLPPDLTDLVLTSPEQTFDVTQLDGPWPTESVMMATAERHFSRDAFRRRVETLVNRASGVHGG